MVNAAQKKISIFGIEEVALAQGNLHLLLGNTETKTLKPVAGPRGIRERERESMLAAVVRRDEFAIGVAFVDEVVESVDVESRGVA